jgi:hypothetical protein
MVNLRVRRVRGIHIIYPCTLTKPADRSTHDGTTARHLNVIVAYLLLFVKRKNAACPLASRRPVHA